jgi:hypothetical protein
MVFLATLASVPLLAQQDGTAGSPASPQAVQAPSTSVTVQPGNAGSPAPTEASAASSAASTELKPVKGELVGKLDSKTAKTGDNVVIKTREAVQTADGTEIPKGSKLMGHVALVRAHSKDVQNSQLTLDFDHAELKGGQTVAIRSMIESVALPAGGGQTGGVDAFSGAPIAPTGGAPMSGGGISGSRGSSPGVAPTTTGTAMPSATVAGNAPAADGSPAPGKVVAGSGPNAIRTTSIPNVYLASNADGPASGTLFAAKDNVHLDGGTEIVLDIAATNSR